MILQIQELINAFLLKNTALNILQRGKKYFKEGRLIDQKYNAKTNTFLIEVQGEYVYTVQVKFEISSSNSYFKSVCNCPYDFGEVCKHQVAALLSIAADKQTIGLLIQNKNEKGKLREDFYRIENFLNLTAQRFLKEYNSNTINLWSYRLNDFQIEEPSAGNFFVHARYETINSYYSDFEKHTLTIEREGSDLKVKCTCKSTFDHLCKHGIVFFSEMLEEGAIWNFKEVSEEEINEKGKQTVKAYGFDETKKWNNYFKLCFYGFNKILNPIEKYKNYLNSQLFDENYTRSLIENDEKNELGKLGNKIENAQMEMGFFFAFKPETHDLHFVPITGRKNKKGERMKISFNTYNEYLRNDSRLYLKKEDIDLLNLSEALHSKESQHTFLSTLKNASESLSKHPFIYYNFSNKIYNFSKNDLVKINFIPDSPEISYALEDKNEAIELIVTLTDSGEQHAIDTSEIEHVHPYFIKIKANLYFLRNEANAKHFAFAKELNNKLINKSQFENFANSYLTQVLKKHQLEKSNSKYIHVKTLESKAIGKEIYLSEVSGFVIFRPFIRYENDKLLNVLTEKSDWVFNKNEFIEQKQDATEVEAFKQLLLALHPEFKNQMRDDYLYIHFDKLLEKNLFFSLFQTLKSNDVKVFGLNKLSKLKINPFPGEVKYKVKTGIDWFEVEAKIVFGDTEISIEDLKKRFVPGNEYIELNDGSKGLIPKEWLKRFEKLFRHSELKNGKLSVSNKKFSLIDELFDEIDDEEVNAFINEKKEKLLSFDKIESYPIPKIKAELRAYQKDGFQWMCFLDDFKWGGILADDMGLGKTLQVITFIKRLLKNKRQTNLIVVPTSLLFNWENEILKFAPSLKVHFHYGPSRSKNTAEFDKFDLVITTYGHMLSDISLLKSYSFNYVILDESQAIKNAASKRYKAARLLQANNRLAMTGTPIENNTFDLYAQMSFLNPGLLGSAKGFKESFAKAIDSQNDENKALELQNIIKPFVLRRTKEQVAKELPDKTEEVLYCEMDKNQRKVYDSFRNEYREKLIEKIEEEGLSKSRFTVLEGLTKLRQICDSPLILSGDEKYEGESVKIDLLIEHIKEKTANHKILVFSQFVSMLKEIEKRLNTESISYEYLDGKSNTKQRKESVDNFQTTEDCRVFLISLKAGGTGLNLMAADYVYIVDPWWNPAVENQAIDRCYRIGQKKNVFAYRMICKNTIEEKIVELQKKKKAIAGNIISTDEGVLKKLNKDDLISLFS